MAASTVRTLLPGLVLLALLGLVARVGGSLGINSLILAVGLGVLVANTVGTPKWAEPGLGIHGLLLETGIVLLGARLALDEVVASGPFIAVAVVGTVLVGVGVVELLGRYADLPARTASLLAAGSSICGVSAVVAVAGAIDADGEDIAYAAATILLFDAVTLVAFPVVGEWLALSSKQFGIWAGLSMFSTGPVAAAGFAHSQAAGQWATVTKLARNSLVGVVAVGYSLRYVRSDSPNFSRIWTRFPKFLVGFGAVVVVANLGVLSPSSLASIGTLSDWLFTLAFVGLGFDIQLGRMRETGLAPILVVLGYLVVVSLLTLTLVTNVV